MKKLVILGGSGIGMIAASIAKESGDYNVLGFLNDVIPVGSKERQKMIRLTRQSEQKVLKEDFNYFAFVPLLGEKGWN